MANSERLVSTFLAAGATTPKNPSAQDHLTGGKLAPRRDKTQRLRPRLLPADPLPQPHPRNSRIQPEQRPDTAVRLRAAVKPAPRFKISAVAGRSSRQARRP